MPSILAPLQLRDEAQPYGSRTQTLDLTSVYPMDPEDSQNKQVWQFPRENGKAAPAQQSDALPDIDPQATSADDISGIKAPPFLHEREISDAFRAVNLIATGRNPFTNEPFEKLRPEHLASVLQALCVLVSAISQAKPVAMPIFQPPPSASVDSSSKRPLEQYLDRIEREAIVEALVETGNNRTAAARLLGITFRALRYRLERLGLDVGHEAEPPNDNGML
jgi:hypothetical protein